MPVGVGYIFGVEQSHHCCVGLNVRYRSRSFLRRAPAALLHVAATGRNGDSGSPGRSWSASQLGGLPVLVLGCSANVLPHMPHGVAGLRLAVSRTTFARLV